MEDLGGRILQRIEALGLTQSALARRVGITQPAIANLIKRGTGRSAHLHKIAAVLQTTPAYLTGETEDPTANFVPSPSIASVANSFGLVEVRELDLALGLGATYLDVPITETMRRFDREFLRIYTHSAPENLLFAQGLGDSMQPTIHDSDLLLIDCSQKTVTMSDKIWAVSYAGCGMVKRLRITPSHIVILSDNPLVPDATTYEGELHVLGRVVAIVRKM